MRVCVYACMGICIWMYHGCMYPPCACVHVCMCACVHVCMCASLPKVCMHLCVRGTCICSCLCRVMIGMCDVHMHSTPECMMDACMYYWQYVCTCIFGYGAGVELSARHSQSACICVHDHMHRLGWSSLHATVKVHAYACMPTCIGWGGALCTPQSKGMHMRACPHA